MFAINPDELGNIYVLAPPPEEGKPQPLIRLNKKTTTMRSAKEDISTFASNNHSFGFASNTLAEFRTGEFQLFFIPEGKDQSLALREIENLVGSPIEFKEISEPTGLILFLNAFVINK